MENSKNVIDERELRRNTIGCDLGNAETKSRHFQFISGHTAHATLPHGASNYLYINNHYFIPNATENFIYEALKTNERWANLILMSISNEIIYRVCNNLGINAKNPEAASDLLSIQEEISTYDKINLALGLPPGDFEKYKNPLLSFYKEFFAGHLTYESNGFQFSYKIENISVFPQDIAALLIYRRQKKENILTRMHSICYGIDIGGFTADFVRTIEGRSDLSNSDSLPLGINVLHNRIATTMRKRYGINVEKANVTLALKRKETFFDSDELNTIYEEANNFTNELMNKLVETGIDLKHNFIIFLGGGSLLLKPFIEKNPLLNQYWFISNPRINAKGFEILMIDKLKRGCI